MEHQLITMFKESLVIPKMQNVFDMIPNEMMRAILVKIEVAELISIRAVSKRWQLVIEAICAKKQSLVIQAERGYVSIEKLSKMFNQLVDFDKSCFVFKIWSTRKNSSKTIFMTNKLCNFLMRLFPRIENLIINAFIFRSEGITVNAYLMSLLQFWSPTIVTLFVTSSNFTPELAPHINNLTGLKRLSCPNVHFLEPATIARLEHYSFNISIQTQLVLSCTSLYLNGFASINDIGNWPEVHAPLVNGLKRLRIGIHEQQVLPFICDHFSSLQLLDIDYSVIPQNLFNDDSITSLARLSNLSQLSIANVMLDLATLDQPRLPTLNSVQILEISCAKFPHGRFDGGQFCRILSTIFPNVEQLTIEHRDERVRRRIRRQLNRFVHLRKRSIVYPAE